MTQLNLNKKIYQHEFQGFSITQDYVNCLPDYKDAKCLILSKNVFIVPISILQKDIQLILNKYKLYSFDIDSCQEIIEPYFNRHNLLIFKISKLSEKLIIDYDARLLLQFNINLLVVMDKWCKHFLKHAMQYLMVRSYDNHKLINNEIIQSDITEVVENLKRADALLYTSIISHDYILAQVADYFIDAMKKLTRLAGGRAMLEGNVVEALWTFEILKNIYFQDEQGCAHG